MDEDTAESVVEGLAVLLKPTATVHRAQSTLAVVAVLDLPQVELAVLADQEDQVILPYVSLASCRK
jgi:hypothetical protein